MDLKPNQKILTGGIFQDKMRTIDRISEMSPYPIGSKTGDFERDKYREEELRRYLKRDIVAAGIPESFLEIILGETQEKISGKFFQDCFLKLRDFYEIEVGYESERSYEYYPTGGKSDSISGIRYEKRSESELKEYEQYRERKIHFYKEMIILIEELERRKK